MPRTHFEQFHAHDLPHDRWDEIVALNEAAVRAAYPPAFTHHPEVRKTMGVDDVAAYRESLRRRQVQDQLHEKPTITMVVDGDGDLLAVAYTTQNTSGATQEDRERKMRNPLALKRWLWFGWIATAAEQQGNGLATQLVGRAMRWHHPLQPMSAYAWPNYEADTPPPIDKALRANSFSPQGDAVALPRIMQATDRIPTQKYVRQSPLRY